MPEKENSFPPEENKSGDKTLPRKCLYLTRIYQDD